jgi:hypothetical protein
MSIDDLADELVRAYLSDVGSLEFVAKLKQENEELKEKIAKLVKGVVNAKYL